MNFSKKIILTLILSLSLLVWLQTMAIYQLTNSDLTFVNTLEWKINQEINKKWETQRQKFIMILTTLKNGSKVAEKPKAMFEELIKRLTIVAYDYDYTNTATWIASTSNELTSIRQEILKLVNQERVKVWLSALTLNNKLSQAAQLHAQDMKNKNYFDHVNKEWKSVADRVKTQGYNYNYVGENIAWNQRTAIEVMKSWMNSAWHKANILNVNYKEIWIWLQDRYRVQVFGKSQQ